MCTFLNNSFYTARFLINDSKRLHMVLLSKENTTLCRINLIHHTTKHRTMVSKKMSEISQQTATINKENSHTNRVFLHKFIIRTLNSKNKLQTFINSSKFTNSNKTHVNYTLIFLRKTIFTKERRHKVDKSYIFDIVFLVVACNV